jgi:putative hydrolase of the HAD superfamily
VPQPPTDIQAERIGAAVFDLGGVLMGGGPSEVIAFGDRIGLEANDWETLRREVFGNHGTWARLERGECTLAEFVEGLRTTLATGGTAVTAEEAATFLGVADPFEKRSIFRTRMLDRVRALHAVMPTALLTNNVREWRDSWRNALDLPSLFDVVVDSSDVGARKPEPAIYEITRERLGVAHDAIFFVDDIGQNLKAARSLGWQTYLFREEGDALATLDTVLAAAQAAVKRGLTRGSTRP